MRNSLAVITCAVGLAIAAPGTAAAQNSAEPIRFGVQLNYGSEADIGIGGRVVHSLRGLFPAAPLSGIFSADIYFPGNDIKAFDINYNVVYNFYPRSAPKVMPYVGAGLDLAHASANGNSNTELGINFLGGMNFRTAGRLTPFVELKLTAEGSDQFVITGGLKF